jgi:hypothetical protein
VLLLFQCVATEFSGSADAGGKQGDKGGEEFHGCLQFLSLNLCGVAFAECDD